MPRRTSLNGESGQFGDPQPGLGGEDEQGVVAAAVPGGAVGGGEQRVELAGGQVADDVGGDGAASAQIPGRR